MIKKILDSLKNYFIYGIDVFDDALTYFKFSTLRKKNDSKNLRAKILAHVHSIERAFSLKNTKEEFGTKLLENLKCLIDKIDDPNFYKYELKIFKSTLKEYNHHHNIKNDVKSNLHPYKKYKHDQTNRKSPFDVVVKSRHSIRDFGNLKIKNSSVIKAIALTKNITPSVCNRQGWHIILIRDPKKINNILKIQNGNSGIENIQNLIIVCSTLTSFFGSGERHQPYVDGGIFLMSLLNSLHYYNVASCALGWTVDFDKNCQIRNILNIKPSNAVIALIAIGSYTTKEINIASSYRKPLNNILEVIN